MLVDLSVCLKTQELLLLFQRFTASLSCAAESADCVGWWRTRGGGVGLLRNRTVPATRLVDTFVHSRVMCIG